jgi:hypothetical protein
MESNYKSKGFNEHAAQAMAVEAMEGREEALINHLGLQESTAKC